MALCPAKHTEVFVMPRSQARPSSGGITMTEGSLFKNIFLFSVPLMLTHLLEVLFNISDVAVVGRFADYRALGSVGSTSLLVSLFIGFLIGMGTCVNVRTAHQLGAGDENGVRETVHSSLLLCAFIGIFICIVCLIGAAPILSLLNTKEELMDGAVLYMKIYALGMPAMAIYNFGNGVLNAAGDTRRPLIYLSIAGVLNVLLNLFFVIVCHRAADGVAAASAISQYLSAGLILFHLLHRKDVCRIQVSKLRLHPAACKSVLMLGIPTGIQDAIFAIANLFVQSGVNSFDAVMVSGNSAAANADSIIFNVLASFYTACSTFISQNWGAQKKKRMLNSYLICLLYSFSTGAILGGLLLIFGRQFLSLFATEQAVIDCGMERLRIMSFSYAVGSFMDCTLAASRGIGKTTVPTIVVILGSCVFRIIWIYTIFAYFHTITSLYLLYIFSWAITAVVQILYFRSQFRKL